MYEYEISKLEDSKRNVNVSQKTVQYALMIKEKRSMNEKLKQQFIKEQKAVQDNTRRLENNSQRDEIDLEMKKLGEEMKFYKEKVKFIEEREQVKAGNMKRQYDAIKKYENKALEGGLAGGELEELKRNAINSINLNTYTAKKASNTARAQSLKESGLLEGE